MVNPDHLLTAALRYAELGYRVFPCIPGTKHPLTTHGFHDASTDPAQIERWWSQHPRANVGIAAEGLLVVDIDGTDNPWPGDPEHAADLAGAGAIALTPRGGRHYLFRRTEGKSWKCSTGRLAPGVDIRTDGGYIVAAPSGTEDGPYRWGEGLELDGPLDQLPDPPAWLAAALDALVAPESNGVAHGPPTIAHVAASAGQDANPIPSGQRNATLARLAGTMRRVGMGLPEIAAALHQTNRVRCRPPLADREVERIAESIVRYKPDQIATAMAEGHWDQLMAQEPELAPISLADLVARYPHLRPPVVHGLLREGETMNVIASPKIGKSWLVTDLTLAVATGRPWLDTFPCEQGRVLIIDNELHGETLANRIPKVMAARGITLTECGDRIDIVSLRGKLKDIFGLGPFFSRIEPGQYKLVVVDAFYRAMPKDMDENDNGTMAQVYNVLDAYAANLQCAFVLIHHSTKGNQSGKAVTDVGAGAGAQSRAADTHLVLRPHEEPDVAVLDAAVRSWPPIEAKCLRWSFPLWTPANDLDPTLLRGERSRRAPRKTEPAADDAEQPKPTWDVERFASAFVTAIPKTRDAILSQANAAGLSDWKAERLLRRAEGLSLVYRWTYGRNRPSAYAIIPQPVNEREPTSESPV